MTPDADAAAAAAERTEAAVQLIEQARHSDVVELVTVSALELCVLGGPKQPLFEEPVAHAWLQLGNRRRRKLIEWVTEGMVDRGLLIEGNAGFSPVSKGTTYSLKPALGIALAARCRPAFIITVTTEASLRAPRFFALGDRDHPLRGVVVEEPAVLPADIAGDYPHVKKFGPLGRMYRHVLVSPQKAAEALAEVAISPPPQSAPALAPPAAGRAPGWTVSVYRQYDGRNPIGCQLTVHGDGARAHLVRPGDDGAGTAEYDFDALTAVMLTLITGQAR
jgi:hypothetical protein